MSKSKQNQVERIQTSKQMFNAHSQHGIDIVFQNISYSVKVLDDSVKSKIPCSKAYKDKQILKNISGIFKSGKTTAIMGASGAGKTTLLNILACRIQSLNNGKLYANNLQYDYNNFGDFANYVMQSDVLMQTLTVRQTLEFAAKLKLNISEEERKERMLDLVAQLKLEKCLDTLVGGVIVKGVSGGEKKRTSIAFQLISNPTVLFLDQPTSGLDSLTSYIIVSYLKKLARTQKKTIIMTIHQPNSQTYALFDNLTVLLQGKIIYQGISQQIKQYFASSFNLKFPQFVNPSDYFMSKIHYQDQSNRKRYPEYFSAYTKNQEQPVQKMIQNKQTKDVVYRQVNVSLWTAMSALIKRNTINSIRNPMLLKAKFIQGIFMSLFIGGIFWMIGKEDYTVLSHWQSITGFLFFIGITAMMTTLSPITLTFPLERDVFFKQQDAKMYSTVQYFAARSLIQIPQLCVMPLIAVVIYYFMIGLSATAGQFFLHSLIFFLISFCGSSLGLLIGSAILDAKSVSAVVPIIILPIFLFSGFFKNRADLPGWIGWLQFISPLKYGFIGFVENQVADKASRVATLNYDVEKWPAIIILFCLGAFFRLMALFFLWFLRKKSQ